MQIQMEPNNQNTITGYSDTQIKVAGQTYEQSLIISKESISLWPVHSLDTLTKEDLDPILKLQPKIILLGQNFPQCQINMSIRQWLSTHQIGVECMDLGAACRTFNVLLSEERSVVLGLILK